MNFTESALKLLARWKPVFPVDRTTKKPLVEWKPFQERIPTEGEVTTWGTLFPQANIGMATGKLSGCVIIDCDSSEAAGRLLESYPEASKTLQAKTGRGVHFYFQFEDGIRNDAGKRLGQGIDIRGEGGFVVVPPSIHANGNTYTWLNRNSPARLPEKLREILVTRPSDNQNGYRERFDTARALAGVPEGQRDETLFRLACKLRNADVPRDMAEALILEAARNCEPPFSERIASEKVERAYRTYSPRAELNRAGSPENSIPPLREKPCGNEFRIVSWRDFLETVPEERDYRIEGLLPHVGLAVLCGRGKQGKSTLVIHALRSVASGSPFLGRKTKPAPVVYVNYEMADDYFQTLLRAGDCPDNTFLVTRPGPVLSVATVGAIIEGIKSPAGILVIDSFRGAFKLQGEGENEAGGAGVILRTLQDLAIKTGWLIFVVHHSNRGGREGTDSISGTSDWIAAPDVIWSWSRPDPEKSGTLTIEGRLPPLEPLAVKLSLEECVHTGTVKKDREQTEKKNIMGVLSGEGQTAEVIAEATGLPAATVRKRLDSLYQEESVNRDGKGVKGDPYFWSKIRFRTDSSLREETNSETWEEVS